MSYVFRMFTFYFMYIGSVIAVRHTSNVALPTTSPGSRRHFVVHKWGDDQMKRAYIQASMHAGEIPGILVTHHLIKMIDAADARGDVLQQIVIVPFANPIGLSQHLLDTHLGRYCMETSVNFNRKWLDLTNGVSQRISERICSDAPKNVDIIRQAILEELSTCHALHEDAALKLELLRLAAPADIVLDLHCDSDAILHMYTLEAAWPALSDLAAELNSQCHMLAPMGGDCFDEVLTGLWSSLQRRFPQNDIPIACEAVTVELRGEADVYDDLAKQDAQGLFRFLQRRGFIAGVPQEALPALSRPATPLAAADMMEADRAGVVAWFVRPGQDVVTDELLGEIVDVEDVDAPRTPVRARTNGVVFSILKHKLVRPGQVIIKIAGSIPLPWRHDNLLPN